jgi:hypothetical protein
MSASDPRTLHDAYGRKLAEFVEMVRTGKAFSDQTTAERILMRLLGTLLSLQQCHQVDAHGRCSVCRTAPRTGWWPWPRRSTCTVHTALRFHLGQPDQFILAAITNNANTARGVVNAADTHGGSARDPV